MNPNHPLTLLPTQGFHLIFKEHWGTGKSGLRIQCEYLSSFTTWWYKGVTAWSCPSGAGVDDSSKAVFFEIFWPFSFCSPQNCILTLSVRRYLFYKQYCYFCPSSIDPHGEYLFPPLPCMMFHHDGLRILLPKMPANSSKLRAPFSDSAYVPVFSILE